MLYRALLIGVLINWPFLSVRADAGDGDGTGYWDNLQIHGFASLAGIKTSDNRFFGDSPHTSFDFSELGLNVSLRPAPTLLISAQLLARRAGEMYDGEPALDYALLDYCAAATPDYRLGLRVGRIKNPLGLYNETRDVPFTRPGIFMPQVVYFDQVRNLLLSSDGLVLYGDAYTGLGSLSLSVLHGRAVVDENVEWAYLNGDFPGDVESRSDSWIWSLWFATAGDRLRLGFSGASLSVDFDPRTSAPPILGAGSFDILYWIASIQYDAEDWTLSAELMREPIDWHDFGALYPDRRLTAEGYYLQAAYRVSPGIELMMRYEEGFADRADRSGKAMSRVGGGQGPAHMGYSKIWTAGLRWDLDRHWMLRLEYQRHSGTFTLSSRENPYLPGQVKDWNLVAAQIAFRF
ncbi:hypothetical protein [Imhoffiella purpurea]|uniref:Porin domain-containing protein n=1 Tax=Imhoffiella purpurea TaxID=1249627 RepID=W9V6M8_9GAMM|nr:hypothetical protein [Imhoffiella purpurea]EXJ15218.1 hypothetical protein D779_1516 [Imhoffiella purpurea]